MYVLMQKINKIQIWNMVPGIWIIWYSAKDNQVDIFSQQKQMC